MEHIRMKEQLLVLIVQQDIIQMNIKQDAFHVLQEHIQMKGI